MVDEGKGQLGTNLVLKRNGQGPCRSCLPKRTRKAYRLLMLSPVLISTPVKRTC